MAKKEQTADNQTPAGLSETHPVGVLASKYSEKSRCCGCFKTIGVEIFVQFAHGQIRAPFAMIPTQKHVFSNNSCEV